MNAICAEAAEVELIGLKSRPRVSEERREVDGHALQKLKAESNEWFLCANDDDDGGCSIQLPRSLKAFLLRQWIFHQRTYDEQLNWQEEICNSFREIYRVHFCFFNCSASENYFLHCLTMLIAKPENDYAILSD